MFNARTFSAVGKDNVFAFVETPPANSLLVTLWRQAHNQQNIQTQHNHSNCMHAIKFPQSSVKFMPQGLQHRPIS